MSGFPCIRSSLAVAGSNHSHLVEAASQEVSASVPILKHYVAPSPRSHWAPAVGSGRGSDSLSFVPSQPLGVNPFSSPFSPHHDNKVHSPFDPRFQVERLEVSDEEWRQEILTSLQNGGLHPGLIRTVPTGMVNINFGTHDCVHMGTEIEPEMSAYQPSDVSWPNPEGSVNALIMIDADRGNKMHWMIVNIAKGDVYAGRVVAEYQSPTPLPGESGHRFVVMVMAQTQGLIEESRLEPFRSSSCSNWGRGNLNLDAFRAHWALGEPMAVNYFTVTYDPFVDSIIEFCGRQS
eukprot:maker-scaffold212_size255419-snap-gene-0.9 protein:Tk00539 transcript:maker-scaffold212_size255419-snap-gene-0.9-mRNA-1 annotation:"ov-16 antigen precursor"